LVALLFLGCSSSAGLSATVPPALSTSPPDSPPSASGVTRLASLGRLQMKDRSVTLLASRDGVRFTVEDGAGVVLAREVSIDDLRRMEPLLYEVCQSAVVHNHAFLDARLDLPRRPESPR
jgi:hypothetical protein